MKFRTRRYIKQFLKENKGKKTVTIDISKFDKQQANVIGKKIHNYLLRSRENEQSVSIHSQAVNVWG